MNAGRRPSLPLGTVLDDRFQLVEVLGAGAFGAVYRARQLVFGQPFRQVALKLFAAERVTADNVAEVFNDAIMLVGLQEQSPSLEVRRHLVEIYDIGVVQKPAPQAFMSMKLVTGKRTLHSEIVKRYGDYGMPVGTALGLFRQLLVPLAWMHTLAIPVVHGDLKPENVLITEAGDVVLTDFGLSALLPLGVHGGTLPYQAPELLTAPGGGGGGDERSDVFSLGVILYEMLTGRTPYAGAELEAAAAGDDAGQRHAHARARKRTLRPPRLDDDPRVPERVVPPSEINAEMREHVQLEALLARCLSYAAMQRPANADLLLRDLDGYLERGKVSGVDAFLSAGAAAAAQPAPRGDKTPAGLAEDALALLAQHRVAEAAKVIERALARDPRCVPALLARARLLAKQKDRSALELCAEAKKLAPTSPEVASANADILRDLGKPSLAREFDALALRLKAHTH